MRVCPQCGNRDDAGAFCSECGAPLPRDAHSTVLNLVPVAAEPVEPTHMRSAPAASGAGTQRPPYPASFSPPCPPDPTSRDRHGQRSHVPAFAALGLLLFGAAMFGTWWMLDRHGDEGPPAVPTDSTASVALEHTTRAASPTGGHADVTAAPAPTGGTAARTVTMTVTQPAPQQPAPVPSAVPSNAAPPAEDLWVPGPATAPPGSYILVLESFEKNRHSPERAYHLAEGYSGRADVIDSSLTPGLRSGYWAVVSARSYASASSASDDCASFGREASGACYPRRVG